MQAIIKIGAVQHLVSVGQELLVAEPVVESVLMVIDGDKVHVGQPAVAGANVEIKVLGEERGPKVRTAKYKAKSRYRKTRGFRAEYTRVAITAIGFGDTKATAPAAPKKTAKVAVKKN